MNLQRERIKGKLHKQKVEDYTRKLKKMLEKDLISSDRAAVENIIKDHNNALGIGKK